MAGNVKGQPYHRIKGTVPPFLLHLFGIQAKFLLSSQSKITLFSPKQNYFPLRFSGPSTPPLIMEDSNCLHSSSPTGLSQLLQGTLNEGNINIDNHASIPTPALKSLHRRSTMSQTSDEFVGSLLRDSPEASNVAIGSGSTSSNVDDSQGPLNVMPLRSLMGPPSNLPPARDLSVVEPESSKGKGITSYLRPSEGQDYSWFDHRSLVTGYPRPL
ncbi:hypothetical protein LIER_38876 [Lithospermum erythrorhizon]|uniref:Uncharacterized protein n=1 Tax=Lithospermum erythrorhizon TaxID=34254 RepID=A0AAV3Q7H5_LITER